MIYITIFAALIFYLLIRYDPSIYIEEGLIYLMYTREKKKGVMRHRKIMIIYKK